MMIGDPQIEGVGKCIISGRRSQLGAMTVHGCAYAGSKGVTFGPTKNMAHISYGPIGYGQYSRAGRHDCCISVSGVDSFGTLNFTSDFQERDIVSDGNKKLTRLIEEMEQLFPLTKGITIQSEYPMGLTDDSVSAVANASSKAPDKLVTPVHYEGFRGVPQSLDHHIANNVVRDWVLNSREGQPFASTPHDVAIIGDYNIGGDAWASRVLSEEMGLRLVTQWSGDGTLVEVENTPFVKLSLVYCCRSTNHTARRMGEKHQIPWMEYNFFGPTKIAESLRKVADQPGGTIRANAEAVIVEYEGQMATIITKYCPRLEGRKVPLCMRELRPRHVIGAYEGPGMEITIAGYGFAHNDDHDRTLPDLREGILPFNDASSHELEAFIKVLKPGLIDPGIREKYIFQKMKAPFRQTYSRDYPGPYHGYDDFVIFVRDMDMTLNSPAQNGLTAPRLESA